MRKYLLALAATATVTTPAFADYYVIRRPHQGCEIVESRPVGTTVFDVGPIEFATRDEAEREVRVICRDSYDDDDDVIIEHHRDSRY